MEKGCDETKPGDQTDPLIYPWLSTERIFEIGDAPPLESYQKFYSDVMTRNIGKTYAIIAMNSEVCVTTCTMITDLRFIPDLPQLVSSMSECLSIPEQDTPIIAIYLVLAWISDVVEVNMDHALVSRSTYGKNFCGYEKLTIGRLQMHANMLIVDRIEKTLERFEPNDSPYENAASKNRQRSIDVTILRDILPLLGEGYRYCDPQSFCPMGGPQMDDEYCAAWSLFYLHLRLTNPNLSRREIVRRLERIPLSPPILVDYMEVMKNTYDALRTGSKNYDIKTRVRLGDLSRSFSSKHFGWVLKYMSQSDPVYVGFLNRVYQSYRRAKKESIYWSDVFRGRAAWITDDDRLQYMLDDKVKL